MDLARVHIHAAGTVTHQGVVVKAVPQAFDHVDKLMRPLVAHSRVGVRVDAEIAMHVVGAGGDHVPGRAALADVVQRGELARQQVGVFVGGGGGGHKADVLRDRRQRRPQRDRLEVRDPALAAQRFITTPVPQARAVGHKHLVEQAALGRLGHLDVVVDVDTRIDLRARVAPGGHVVAGGHDKGAQTQFSCFTHVDSLVDGSDSALDALAAHQVAVGGVLGPVAFELLLLEGCVQKAAVKPAVDLGLLADQRELE